MVEEHRTIFDPGWLFLAAGLAFCVALVLIPAQRDLDLLRQQHHEMHKQVNQFNERMKAHADFLDHLEQHDTELIQRLAGLQLNLIPEGNEPVLLTRSQLSASAIEWVEQTISPIQRETQPLTNSLLSNMTCGSHRHWLIAAAGLCTFIGLLLSPNSKRTRIPFSKLPSSEDENSSACENRLRDQNKHIRSTPTELIGERVVHPAILQGYAEVEEPIVQCETSVVQSPSSIPVVYPVNAGAEYEEDDLEPVDVVRTHDIAEQARSIVDESFAACEPLLLPDQCNLLKMKIHEADSDHGANNDEPVAKVEMPVAKDVVSNASQNMHSDVVHMEMFPPEMKVDEEESSDSLELVGVDKEEENEAIENLEVPEAYKESDELDDEDEDEFDETNEDDVEYEEVEEDEESEDDDNCEYEYVYEYEYIDEDPSAEDEEWVDEDEDPDSEVVDEITDSWDDSVESK